MGNVEDIGLEGTKVEVDRSHINTDPYGQTGEPGVWAIGDLTGPPWLAHKASHEGIIAVEKIAGSRAFIRWIQRACRAVPMPVRKWRRSGLPRRKPRTQGHKVRVGRFPFVGNGKAIALGEPEGSGQNRF